MQNLFGSWPVVVYLPLLGGGEWCGASGSNGVDPSRVCGIVYNIVDPSTNDCVETRASLTCRPWGACSKGPNLSLRKRKISLCPGARGGGGKLNLSTRLVIGCWTAGPPASRDTVHFWLGCGSRSGCRPLVCSQKSGRPPSCQTRGKKKQKPLNTCPEIFAVQQRPPPPFLRLFCRFLLGGGNKSSNLA